MSTPFPPKAAPFRQSAYPPPPVAAVRPVEKTVPATTDTPAVTRVDPYDWLRDPAYPEVRDPAILDYLAAENAYIETVLGGEDDLRPALVRELRARMREDDTGVPYVRGAHVYQSRYAAGQNHPVIVRWPLAPVGAPVVGAGAGTGDALAPPSADAVRTVLDINALAAGLDFCRVAEAEPSPDGRLLAYTADTDGSERFRVRVVDIDSGALRLDGAEDAVPGVAWSADGRFLFYVRQDRFQRAKTVWRHELGAAGPDVLVYEEMDAAWMVGIGASLSGRFIQIMAHNNVSSEVRLLDAAAPTAAPRLVLPRRQGHQYEVADQGDTLWLLTNDTHRNFRLARRPLAAALADDAAADPEVWEEVIAPGDRLYLTGLLGLRDWLLVFCREDGAQRVRVIAAGGDSHTIAFPDPAFEVEPVNNLVYDAAAVRLRYQSLVTPPTVYDYDLAARSLTVRKVQEIPSGYDPARYVSHRLLATAADGTRIPVSVVHRRDFPLDGSGALHLYGYGAYGLGLDPWFSTHRIGLLDRGFAFAIAHVRGGDEMGRGWYEDGKLAHKTNSFDDFIAVARFLVAEGYASDGAIAIEGGSAGGLLMGAVLNRAPEGLFRAAILQVPFVDVVNTMLDDTLPLTTIEYDEWGNPHEPGVLPRLAAYSPYDTITRRRYPHMLITAGLSDPRVTYWEPAKYAARVRAAKTGDSILLSRTEMGAGHAGAAGRFDKLKEVALSQAFLLRAFGKTL